MGLFALLFSIVVLVYTRFVAKAVQGAYLRTPYMHPFFFFGFMTVLIGTDFFVLEGALGPEGLNHYFSQHLLSGQTNYNTAVMCFVLLTMTAVFGFSLGLLFPLPFPVVASHFRTRQGRPSRPAMWVCAVFVGLFMAFMAPALLTALVQGGLLAVAGLRSVFLGQSAINALIVSCMVPAFFLICASGASRRTLLLVFLGLAFLNIIIGSRGAIMMLILAYAVGAFGHVRIRLPVLAVSFFVLVMVGYYYTYLTRYSWQYPSLSVFWQIEGDPFSYIMNSPELSIAEAMMLHLNETILSRNWYDSILGALFAYVPRDIIPWKPIGLSAAMTAEIDLERWLLVRSEWTVSGYVNALYEMGTIGGATFNFLLFFIFGGLDASARDNRSLRVFTTAVLIYLLLGYLRGDIYNMGLRVWSVIVTLIVFRITILVMGFRRVTAPA